MADGRTRRSRRPEHESTHRCHCRSREASSPRRAPRHRLPCYPRACGRGPTDCSFAHTQGCRLASRRGTRECWSCRADRRRRRRREQRSGRRSPADDRPMVGSRPTAASRRPASTPSTSAAARVASRARPMPVPCRLRSWTPVPDRRSARRSHSARVVFVDPVDVHLNELDRADEARIQRGQHLHRRAERTDGHRALGLGLVQDHGRTNERRQRASSISSPSGKSKHDACCPRGSS